MKISLREKGIDELIKRMDKYPEKVHALMDVAMRATLLTTHENVMPYPAAKPDSTYRRTGTLGRTLGSDTLGGVVGAPEIFEVRSMGSNFEGHFGTNLEYAPYVIGDTTQAKIHQGRWWTLSKVVEKAMPKIERIWKQLAETMAKYLEGK